MEINISDEAKSMIDSFRFPNETYDEGLQRMIILAREAKSRKN